MNISEFTTSLVQQKKLFNMESQQLKLNKSQNKLLIQARDKFSSYRNFDLISDEFQLVTHEGVISSKFLYQGVLFEDKKSYSYKIYRIDLLADEQYASKLHIYVAVCEDVRTQTDLKILPISNLLN